MTKISDLSFDVLVDILSRLSITSLGAVRSTCKPWYALSKDQSFTNTHLGKAPKEFLVNMTWSDSSIKKSSRRLGLHNIKDLPSLQEIGKILSMVNIFDVYECNGLLLCVTNFQSRLLLCNPYMAQTRWIEVNDSYHREYCKYAIGHDNNNNYKILRYFYDDGYLKCQIYDFKSNSWRVLNTTTNCYIRPKGVSLKGYIYFVGKETSGECFVISFDFTTERFGPRMYLPCHSGFQDNIVPSCVNGEQLAVLHQKHWGICELEILVTTKIDPNTMSWSKFLKVDFYHHFEVCSFFVDREKKIVVLSGTCYEKGQCYDTSYVVGEDGIYEETGLKGEVFPYVPSSVLIQ